MTVKELQKELANALNGVEGLVQRGCKAFAEDSREIYKESDKWVSAGKTAILAWGEWLLWYNARRFGICEGALNRLPFSCFRRNIPTGVGKIPLARCAAAPMVSPNDPTAEPALARIKLAMSFAASNMFI